MTKIEMFKAGVVIVGCSILGVAFVPLLTLAFSCIFLWNLLVSYGVAAVISLILVFFVSRYLIDRANFKEDAADNQ